MAVVSAVAVHEVGHVADVSTRFLLAAWIGGYKMFSTLFAVQGTLHHSARSVDPLSPPHRIASLKSLQLALSWSKMLN